MASEEPLLRVRNVICDFESLRRAIIEMAAPKRGVRRELRDDPSLFLERFVVERGGSRLDQGRIRFEGGKGGVIKVLAFPLGDGRRVVYRIIRLKYVPTKVSYHSMSGRTQLSWRHSPDGGRLYGAVSENSFKILARSGAIPDFMVPKIVVEEPIEARYVKRLERFILERYLKRDGEILGPPGIHVEARGPFLRLYIEAGEKRVLSESEGVSGAVQVVQVRDILGVIARLDPNFNLTWRVTDWPKGILRGRINLRGLKILSELGMLRPGIKASITPILSSGDEGSSGIAKPPSPASQT